MMLINCVFRSDEPVLGMGMRLSIRPSHPAYKKPRFDPHHQRKEREREESVESLTWGGQKCHFLEGNAHQCVSSSTSTICGVQIWWGITAKRGAGDPWVRDCRKLGRAPGIGLEDSVQPTQGPSIGCGKGLLTEST